MLTYDAMQQFAADMAVSSPSINQAGSQSISQLVSQSINQSVSQSVSSVYRIAMSSTGQIMALDKVTITLGNIVCIGGEVDDEQVTGDGQMSEGV
jgi:hypothetical protein